MFDSDLLKTFVRIVEGGSFIAAAHAVGRTPSAVSMQIKRLEEIVGRPLLRRSAHGVQLTPHGEVLLVHARQILDAQDAAFEAMMSERAARSLSVGVPDAHLLPVLGPCLGPLAANFPDTNLRVISAGSPELLRRLEEGGLELALLTEMQVGDDRGELVHSERGVWAAATTWTPEPDAPLPLALALEGSAYRRLAQDLLRGASRPYRVALSSNSEVAVQAAIASGAVVGLLPSSRMAPGLRELTPEEGFPPIPDLQVRLRIGRRRLPPAGEWLVDALRARPLDLIPRAGPLMAP